MPCVILSAGKIEVTTTGWMTVVGDRGGELKGVVERNHIDFPL